MNNTLFSDEELALGDYQRAEVAISERVVYTTCGIAYGIEAEYTSWLTGVEPVGAMMVITDEIKAQLENCEVTVEER